MYNSNKVKVFSTLLYLSCLYDTAVSKFSLHQSRNKSNVKNVSHNKPFWHFWLDVMMTKQILISDIIELCAFFFWLLYCISTECAFQVSLQVSVLSWTNYNHTVLHKLQLIKWFLLSWWHWLWKQQILFMLSWGLHETETP